MKQKKINTQTLYIVHGWAYSLKAWQPTIKLFRKHQLDVKFLQVPGLTLPSEEVWSVESYLAWLHQELKGITKPVILGHSNGGRLLLNYCLQHPNKVGHLILLNSAGIPPAPAQRRKHRRVRTLSKVFGFLKKVPLMRRLVHKVLGVQDYYKAQPNMQLTLKNMLRSDHALQQHLGDIKTPTSMIWGENDTLTPLWQGQRLAKKLGNVHSFEVLAEARHAPYATHPEALVKQINKILKKL